MERRTARSHGEGMSHVQRLAAVFARDRRVDGAFVYAVSTTGIYCRPSCPSRRPSSAHVTFHADGEAARRAGFRACLRCRPDEADPVARARAYLDAHEERVTLAELADHVGLTPSHLQRRFSAVVGLSPRAYQTARQLDRFAAAGRSGASVTDATYAAGFGSARAVHAAAALVGTTPGERARGGAGLAIEYAFVETTLGLALVGCTARGLAVLRLGRARVALLAEAKKDLPRASWTEGLAAARLAPVRACLEGGAEAVPLDLVGTSFQLLVWAALRRIPAGTRTTYAGLAASLGRPGAVRAVARACATNGVAVLVPCHRVVRGDGDLAGYRWGVSRKRALLDREAGWTDREGSGMLVECAAPPPSSPGSSGGSVGASGAAPSPSTRSATSRKTR